MVKSKRIILGLITLGLFQDASAMDLEEEAVVKNVQAAIVAGSFIVSAGICLYHYFSSSPSPQMPLKQATPEVRVRPESPFDSPKETVKLHALPPAAFGRVPLPAQVYGKSYEEVYDPLVCSVLEGNVAGFNQALRAGHNPLQLISAGRTLRHVAYNRIINRRLLELGVAPLDKKTYRLVSAEDMYKHEEGEIDAADVALDRFLARNLAAKDFYGKYPEDYSIEQRRAIADEMKASPYRSIPSKPF